MKCKNCQAEIQDFNYCPVCGEPLTDKAVEVEKQKVLNIRLETLLKLTKTTDDEKTLLLIKELISKIKLDK